MADFSLADARHLEAAEGWLGLGNPAEAKAELDQVTPAQGGHPAMLELRWQVHAAAGEWEPALAAATALTCLRPKDPKGWVSRSFALHELKRTLEARDNLLPVINQFPKHALMRYNLACYESQLGNLPQARQWLAKAFALPGGARLKATAPNDPDLGPLRDKINGV
ncbi:MAG: tetratricopeptide repeat protein [Verrucomicrobiota bacterium]|jgi:predicted Zn-dependent protease